jgi:hypothetical protein
MRSAFDPPLPADKCDWCDRDTGLRIFHFEGKRYCSRGCMDAGVSHEIRRPLFEAKPFPLALRRLRAHVPQH